MVMVRLTGHLANGTFPYLIRKDQPKKPSFVIHLLFTHGEIQGPGGHLAGKHGRQTRRRPMWNTEFTYGPVLPHNSHDLSLCPSLLPSSDVTFQFSDDKKFIFVVLVLSLLLSWCSRCLCVPRKPEHCLVLIWPSSTGFFQYLLWKGKERKRMIYFMYWPPLRPSRILIVEAWYGNLSKVWTDQYILHQLSLLEPPFAQNNFF